MITAKTTKGPVDAETLPALAGLLAILAPIGVTLAWGDEKIQVDVPKGDELSDWRRALVDALVEAEAHVEAGDTCDTYDHGSVVGVDARGVPLVAWRWSLERTTADLAALRPHDEDFEARMAAAMQAELARADA
jgi:hypothetical protein